MISFLTDKAKWAEDSEGFWVSFHTADKAAALTLAGLDKQHEVTVKEKRKARSLDANAYLWVLLDRLSEKLSTKSAPVTKVDIYRRLIPDVGGVSDTICVQNQAVDKLIIGWEHNGLGWIAEKLPSKINGCTNVILYYGSSTYDTSQMSRLLDLVIEECKQQGIETMTPFELSR